MVIQIRKAQPDPAQGGANFGGNISAMYFFNKGIAMLDKKVKMKMPMAKITRDLIAHMRDEDYLDRIITTKLAKDGNIHYDRGNFIKK